MNAIIEIGTNSLKMLIYKTEPDFKTVFDKTIITRLGESYKQTGEISCLALKRNINEIIKCQELIKTYDCVEVLLYGTMIFRSAKNSQDVLKEIHEKTGLNLEIISGQEEAEYSFLAASHSFQIKDKKVLVIDTGGGSTEFIFGQSNQIEDAESLDIGAVTLTDSFSLDKQVDTGNLEKCEAYIKEKFQGLSGKIKPDLVIGIGGTVTTISAIAQELDPYSADKVHGSVISLERITELAVELSLKNFEERKDIIGLSSKRADIILAGVLIVKTIMQKYRRSKMLVCDHGLRYGLALKEWRKK